MADHLDVAAFLHRPAGVYASSDDEEVEDTVAPEVGLALDRIAGRTKEGPRVYAAADLRQLARE